MVPREGKEWKLELRLQRTASIRGSGWVSEGSLRAAVASAPIVGGVLALDFHPHFRGTVPTAHFSPLHETAMLGKSLIHWLVREKQITV